MVATGRAPLPAPAPDAGEPAAPRFALLDPLRGLAAVAILVYHVYLAAGGDLQSWIGRLAGHLTIAVPVFFAISGFLLYRPFVEARARDRSRPNVAGYAWRRVLRIYPAYWVALTALAIYPGLDGVFGPNWWAHYALVQTYPVYTPEALCRSAVQGCGMVQAWTLTAEISFYAFLPLFAAAAGFAARRVTPAPGLELAAIAGVAAVSVAIRVFGGRPELGVTVFGTMLWFAAGMALAVWSVHRPACGLVQAHPGWPPAAAALLFLALVVALPPDPFYRGGSWPRNLLEHLASGAIAALVVLPAVFEPPPGSVLRSVLTGRLLAGLGTISYGIYLWHYSIAVELGRLAGSNGWLASHRPAAILLVGAATLLASCALATLSYRLVERPAMRLRNRIPASHRSSPRPTG